MPLDLQFLPFLLGILSFKTRLNLLKSGDALQEIFEEKVFLRCFLAFEDFSFRIEEMIANPYYKGVSLTGSEAAGRKITEQQAKNLKKCVLIRPRYFSLL